MGIKPSGHGSINASNGGLRPPFGFAVRGWIVTLRLFGVILAPGLRASAVIILNCVGSPTIGSLV